MRSWEDNIKVCLKEIVSDGVAEQWKKCQAVWSRILNLRVP